VDRDDPAYSGQAGYTRALLNLYDPIVLGPVARYVWRCPVDRLVDGYRRDARPRHLDVGPGTGYFIRRSGLPEGAPVTLLDPNPNVLTHASARLHGFDLRTVEADVLKPLPIDDRFASAALNLVLHCLPGPMHRKASAIANVAAVLDADGVLFGASVLGRSGHHSPLARAVLRAFNAEGGFDNLDDSEAGLREILATSFVDVEVQAVGSVAYFRAEKPRVAAG
jgi:SAM-dependent methyltransferase